MVESETEPVITFITLICYFSVTMVAKPSTAGDFFKCEFCPIKAKEFSALSTHHDLNHLNKNPYKEKPFKCGLCGESFGQVLLLSIHCKAEDHQSLKAFCKMFVCGLCPCFAEDSRESLTEHFKTKHRDQCKILNSKRKHPEVDSQQMLAVDGIS